MSNCEHQILGMKPRKLALPSKMPRHSRFLGYADYWDGLPSTLTELTLVPQGLRQSVSGSTLDAVTVS